MSAMKKIIKEKYFGSDLFWEVYKRLIIAANRLETVYYKDIAKIMKIPLRGNHMSKEVGQITGEISEYEHNLNRPMLSSVVIRKDTGEPGDGYFNLAEGLGKLKNGENHASFWRNERLCVYNAWAKCSKKQLQRTTHIPWNKGNTIQLSIALILLTTLLIGGISLFHHAKYYRNSIRPYIECLPIAGKTISVDSLIQWNYVISNKGETPAYNLIYFSMVTVNENFPVEAFKKSLRQTKAPAKGVIYKGDSFTQQKKSKVACGNVENDVNSPVELVFQEKMKLFFHFYFEYLDVNNKKYYLRLTYLFTLQKITDDTSKESWKSINVSEKPIR